MRKTFIAVVLVALVALVVGPATAGGGSKGSRYAGSVWATPNVLHAGDAFTVAGCNYSTDLGNVIIGFTGGSWGSALDAGGCFTITDIPALSGDTLPDGTYEVTVSQLVERQVEGDRRDIRHGRELDRTR